MGRLKLVLMLLLVLVLLLWVLPVAAQDPTTEATLEAVPAEVQAPVVIVEAPAQEATAEAVPTDVQAPVVVVQAPAPTQKALDNLLPVLAAFFAALAGGGSVFLIMNRVNDSKPLKDSTEKLLFDSTPPETVKLLHQIAMVLKGGASFLENVTDGDENVSSVEYSLEPGEDPTEVQQVIDAAVKQYRDSQKPTNPFTV